MISFEKSNSTKWTYLYNATAVSPDNRTYEESCNTTSNTCTVGGLSSATKYSVYMQAFISNLMADDTISYSELSEPLIVYTTGKILHTGLSLFFLPHLLDRFAAGRTFLAKRFHIFLSLIF